MSIRLRLTLLYSAILAVTLVALGIALYVVVSQKTLDLAQQNLTATANSVAATIRPHVDPDQGGILSMPPPPPDLAAQTLIQVRRMDGTVVYQSSDLQAAHYTLPLAASTQQQLQHGGDPVHTVVSVGGKRLLMCSMPLLFQGTPVGILQAARSLQDVDQTLNILRQILLIGGVLGFLAAFGAGWVLAGTALRPINRITQTAREIGAAQDFDRRLDYTGPSDEVGRLAATFNTMLTRLQAAFQAQRRFVADASHELRTPLTSIRGNLGLLQREPPIAEADRVAVVANLVSESERLSRLVGDLLTLARRDAGRTLRQQPVPVVPLVTALQRQLRTLHPGRTIQAENLMDVAVLGDPDALTQVLLILLDNALKFTPAGGTVTVATAANGDHIAIAVRDTGMGIAPDALPHIFERFYQGDAARAGSGTGLGLAIARTLVEGQHGTIGVQSQVGHGSVFTVTLRRATATHAPVLTPASSA